MPVVRSEAVEYAQKRLIAQERDCWSIQCGNTRKSPTLNRMNSDTVKRPFKEKGRADTEEELTDILRCAPEVREYDSVLTQKKLTQKKGASELSEPKAGRFVPVRLARRKTVGIGQHLLSVIAFAVAKCSIRVGVFRIGELCERAEKRSDAGTYVVRSSSWERISMVVRACSVALLMACLLADMGEACLVRFRAVGEGLRLRDRGNESNGCSLRGLDLVIQSATLPMVE
ncbi:unnamed protein product [Dovyalis caffra]|uniref:Uncharacterized protein n=1 Tax=Dovyalis caffra TaxID=77055 RepID=A0AAV1R5U4_9ROSI|nr:unnamed protein product [Dovyalis caffra]